MQEIYLTQGKIALVDEWACPLLSQYRWHAVKNYNTFYAYSGLGTDSSKGVIALHRLLLDARTAGLSVDHIDGNGLNNTLTNLRLCTTRQNVTNSPKRRGKWRFKGVRLCLSTGKWRADIKVSGKHISGGYHLTDVEAAKAYNEMAAKFFGPFAWLNKV